MPNTLSRPYIRSWQHRSRGVGDPLNLIVEIKGYCREDARSKKEAMETRWVPGVNNLGSYGRWAFAELTEVFASRATSRSASRPSSSG